MEQLEKERAALGHWQLRIEVQEGPHSERSIAIASKGAYFAKIVEKGQMLTTKQSMHCQRAKFFVAENTAEGRGGLSDITTVSLVEDAVAFLSALTVSEVQVPSTSHRCRSSWVRISRGIEQYATQVEVIDVNGDDDITTETQSDECAG